MKDSRSPLMGAIYTTTARPTTTRDVQGNTILATTPGLTMLSPAMGPTNMAPDYSMPESPAGSSRASVIIDQVIPGITTTLPTPSNPTVQALSNPIVTTPAQPVRPWYQWFKENPLYTGLIVVGIGGFVYSVTKKKRRK